MTAPRSISGKRKDCTSITDTGNIDQENHNPNLGKAAKLDRSHLGRACKAVAPEEPPKTPPRKRRTSIVHMRTTHETTVVRPDGQREELKTAVVVVKSPSLIGELAATNYLADIKEMKSDRPIADVIRNPLTGSPKAVVTPTRRTRLGRRASYGSMAVFSNQPTPSVEEKPVSTIDESSPFFKSDEFIAAAEAPESSSKREVAEITTATLDAVKKGKQSRNQTRVIGIGAAAYANATQQMPEGQRLYEWLHLVAFFIKGQAGQIPENLVVGTAFANTRMLFVELEIRLLAGHFPGFRLEVDADLVPGTQIAKTISYTIITTAFTLPFVFQAQDFLKPHIFEHFYIQKLIQSFINVSLEKISPAATVTTTTTAAASTPKKTERTSLANLTLLSSPPLDNTRSPEFLYRTV